MVKTIENCVKLQACSEDLKIVENGKLLGKIRELCRGKGWWTDLRSVWMKSLRERLKIFESKTDSMPGLKSVWKSEF